MAIDVWLSLLVICVLGAMSPGPSLALVIKNTMAGGRKIGLQTAIAHGVGVGLYAVIAISGIGLVLVQSPTLFTLIQYLGAGFLVWLAIQALTRKGDSPEVTQISPDSRVHGWRDGFLIAFLNPKLALFFTALFSQFIDLNATFSQQLLMVLTVASVDTLWYCAIVWGLSQGNVLTTLQQHSKSLDRLTGVILLVLAVRVVV